MASRRARRGRKSRMGTPAKEVVVEKVEAKKKGNPIINFYDEKYKALMIIPFAILLVSIIIIGMQIAQTGDFVNKDVSLKGGLTITVLSQQEISARGLEDDLSSEFPSADIRVRAITDLGAQSGLIIDSSDVPQSGLTSFLSKRILDFEDNHSVESIGPSLGGSFFRQTMVSIFVAFLFMSMVVFYYFRTFIPSLAVVLAAFSDIVVTIAVMNLLDIKLSTAGIAALLMLIGYSVDTDILLSTRVLKNKQGSLMDKIMSAVKTGLTMNITTLAAISVALLMSQSETITQIMTILLIGLLIDVINTWIQNVGILKWYIENKK